MKNPREAAYIALLKSLRGEGYINESLDAWRHISSPIPADDRLAQEIAYGSARMALALDYIAEQASEKKQLSLKLKEKALLRTAVYQICFMSKLPLYAVVDESVSLAKRYCSVYFARYLNALLRKVKLVIPEGDSPYSLSIRYSLPQFFIERMVAEYGLIASKGIFETCNRPGITMARQVGLKGDIPVGLIPIADDALPVFRVDDLKDVISSSSFYIQNITPITLIGRMAKHRQVAPKRILDLCASPGGKTLAVHHFFPDALLYANDVSEEKLVRLNENFKKFGIISKITSSRGEDLKLNETFDVIIIDAPCSNSGVFNKRPEARWRLSAESLHEINLLQYKLVENAKKMLSPKGEIWYMTCSILKEENEEMVRKAARNLGLRVELAEAIMPNDEGWDGGFGSILVFDAENK